MHVLDDSFRRQKEQDAAARRTRKLRKRIFWGTVSSVLLAVSVALIIYVPVGKLRLGDEGPAPDAAREEMPAFASTIVDLPGAPLRIELGGNQARQTNSRGMTAPPAFREFGVSGNIVILSEKILPSTERLMTAIPSTQRDFMFFQSQRSAHAAISADQSNTAEERSPQGDTEQASVAADVPVSEKKQAGERGDEAKLSGTEVENNISTVLLKSEELRSLAVEDVFLRSVAQIDLLMFLRENNTDPKAAKEISEYLKANNGLTTLAANSIVAMREFRGQPGGFRRLAQIAIYQNAQFVAAMGVGANGNFVAAADPWLDQNLFRPDEGTETSIQARRYRLLDGVYSVGVRNGVSPSLVGETIMLLSHGHDLGEFATQEDRVTVVYSNEGRAGGEGAGRILYVSIDRSETSIQCFVFKRSDGDDYACMNEREDFQVVELANEMIVPVAGVLTSAFGPVIDRTTKGMSMNNGVDWTAPLGTPVRAAYAGTVLFAADSGDFGNFLRLDHGAGRQTSYAHLGSIAAGIAVGTQVKAGDVIGYVGSSGNATSPRLHFEAYLNGKPINPLPADIASDDEAGGAIERLVDRIVRVESGGNSVARNPKSTAVGLGQFIEATWLRMMRTYRPDLARSLSRDELLSLREDPTLSREMIMHLARENKAYLQSRGSTITSGNLYLAHFLGPEGAATVLAAAKTELVESLVGAGVVAANSFLKGKNAGDVESWAARKMGTVPIHRKSAMNYPRISAGVVLKFSQYKEAILNLLSSRV